MSTPCRGARGAGPGRRVPRLPVAVLVAVLAVLGLGPLVSGAVAREPGPSVLVTRVEGTITPVVADHLAAGLGKAAEEGHQALLVELDTPGGLDTAMRQIIQDFLDAPVPVVVYVTPAGGRAASAGALITFSAHVAAMTPGTTIGAATPVDLQGGEISDKVVNDAAAYAAAVAQERGRNTEFAEATVRDGEAVTAGEALELDAVDLLAPDRGRLLAELDGREIALADGRTVTLHTADAELVDYGMGFFRSLLQLLADPNLAFLFLSLGTLAVIYEFASPGMGLGGVVGVVLLALGFVSLSVLPVNAAGVALLVLAAGLFLAEVFTPGVGVFAAGGAIALLASGLFLFEGSLDVSLTVLVPTSVAIGAGVVLAGRLAWRARRARPVSGVESFLGRELVLGDAQGNEGRAMFEGTYWTVRGRTPLRSGQRVRVTSVDGLTLIVEPLPTTSEGGEES